MWTGCPAPSRREAYKQVVDPDDVVGVPGERGPDHRRTPIVFSSRWGSTSSGPIVYFGLGRNDSRLDVEVAAELLPDHVHVAPEDEVRLVQWTFRRPRGARATSI